MRRRRSLWFVSLSLGLAALFSVSVISPGLPQSKAGGTLRISLEDSDIYGTDPIGPQDAMSILVMDQLYDQLVRTGKDGASVEPDAADRWKMSADGKTWIFHIRDGITFADGTPLTARDAKFSLERTYSQDANFRDFYTGIDAIAAPDPHTLIVTLKSPTPAFLAYLSLFSASIVPEKLVTAQGKAFWDHPIGSGPFVFAEWVKNDHVVLKRNPRYWEKPYPYVDTVRLDVLTDDNTRMLKLRSGELDIATNVPANQMDALRRIKDIAVQHTPQIRLDYIQINHARKPFSDVRVRRALNLAVNRRALVKSVLFDYGTPATSMLPPMLYWNDQLKPYPYDIAQAKSLLAAAGYGSGLSAEILEPSGNADFNQVATILKSEFAAIGVNLTITTLEISTNRARRKAGDFDLYQAYSNSDIIDPSELVDWQIDYTGGGVAKWGNYKSERIIQLAKAASTEIDPKKRKAMYFEAQKIAYDDAEAIPLYNPDTRTAFWTNIHDFTTPPTFNWRLWEVWVSKK